jgi:hypothetical protein
MRKKKMKKLYTNYLQVDEMGLRNIDAFPGDEKYKKLCKKEPWYKLMSVYLTEDVESFIEDIFLIAGTYMSNDDLKLFEEDILNELNNFNKKSNEDE